jgi:UDP-GlcNAc3NAcA epimerase
MKILSIVGARPQFVKAAVFRKYCHENDVNEILLHTGQHFDFEMSVGIFKELDVLYPDITHQLSERSHAGMTGELLYFIEKQIIDIKPDFVNVYGDTNSTLAGALAAAKLHIPVIHIEAGLRSFNKKMPEEINRILTDHISDYLFCPTFDSQKNLKKENITNGVYHVGDIMFDAVKLFKNKFKFPKSIKNYDAKKLAVMTVHRADTVESPIRLKEVIEFCNQYTDKFEVIFPVHPNTCNKIKEFSISTGNIQTINPVSYLEMQGLLEKAELVFTDSGGLQKEAYFHGCDCITLRDQTEWVETIEAGWNTLWKNTGDHKNKININEYGNGNTSDTIIKILKEVKID